MKLIVSEREMIDVGAVAVKDGLRVAFEKPYFFDKILNMEGAGLKALFTGFELVIEGVSKSEVFVRFQAKQEELG